MSISSKFLTLTKKVSKSPMVIDVLNIQVLNEEQNVILDITSKEAEEVMFVNIVFIIDYPRINKWLSQPTRSLRRRQP